MMRRAFTFTKRRLREAAIPEKDRCNQGLCTNRAVSTTIPMSVSAVDYDRQERRCIEHPPPGLAASVARGDTCGHCGRGYWPDTMHFDCYDDEPAATNTTDGEATQP